jgi:phosphoribosyl 1,2-cyclic phosphodiesterase
VAAPGESTLRCGGNTPCVEVRCGARVIVLDAGTGIRELGLKLVEQGVREVDLLISHFHMDHLQGFPFFTPSYHAGVRIDIYLAQLSPGRPLAEPFHKLMEEPHFPVPFRVLAADIRFHEMNGFRQLGEVAVKSQLVNHPGGCIAYRLEYGGKTLVYLTDHESYAGPEDAAVREFTRGADLLIREAQYTSAEYEHHHGWGHGTFEAAAADALESDVKRLALFHHDPQHDDEFLERELGKLQFRYRGSELEIFLAREGQCVELD